MVSNLPASRGPRNTMHPGPASRPAGGCMRESPETPHQVVASREGTAEFREARAVQEFATPVNRARQRRIARKENIHRLPCADPGGFEASAGVVSRGDHPCQEQHFDCTGRLLGNRARQHPVDTLAVGAPFHARIGSQHGNRTQPGSSRDTRDAPGSARRLRAPLATNLRASARTRDAGRTIRDRRDPLMKLERRARRDTDRTGLIALSIAMCRHRADCPDDQAGAARPSSTAGSRSGNPFSFRARAPRQRP